MRSQPTAAATGLASILPDKPAGSLALAAAVAASAQPAHPGAAPLDVDQQWPALAARWADLVRQRAEPDESEDRALVRLAAMDEVIDAAVHLPALTDADRAIKARVLAQASGEIAEDDLLLSGDDAGIAVWARRRIKEGCAAEQLTASLCLDLLHTAPEPTEVAHPDAALIDLGQRWMAIQHEWEDTGDETDVEMKERNGHEGALVSAIVACPAISFAGLIVKARILARESDCEAPAIFADTEIAAWAKGQLQDQVWQDRVVGSLCLDLLRLAQETGR